ncbi:MAG: hypothetical protein F6K16_40210 [Symploca sp. SIO2B6]|nr:hypothetical protein [Symploca sp. SIO2B6]
MENPEDRVSVKSAVETAINYVKDLYANCNLRDLMLEEVEFSEAADQWLITVGFSLPETKEETQSLIMPSKTSRALSRRYKVVNINAATGKPVSMKIRAI